MTKDQLSGGLDRALTVLVTWLLTYLTTKGYITSSQAADFMPLILAIVTAIYGWYVNRPIAIAQSAAALPGTTVVTTADIAQATPNEKNIVSNKTNQVSAL